MGNLGWDPVLNSSCQPENNVNYTCYGGATSFAAPLVTGTAALVMARRPDLTAAQVFQVLENSAVTQLHWGTITPPDTIYGYGRVNALRALIAVSRGDANNDKSVNEGDITYLINYAFKMGPAPIPHLAIGDANCDGRVNIGDIIFLINYVFKGGLAPGLCYRY
jgi:subtilisin family serine protease